jgi:hypothetical protein
MPKQKIVTQLKEKAREDYWRSNREYFLSCCVYKMRTDGGPNVESMRSGCVCYSITLPVALFLLMISCVKKQGGWQGSLVQEDGVTVVRNPSSPLNQGPLIVLRKQFSLDEEDERLVERGLSRIQDFAVDSSGNVFLLALHTEKNFV